MNIDKLVNSVNETGFRFHDKRIVSEMKLNTLPIDDAYLKEVIKQSVNELYYKSLCKWLGILKYTLFREPRIKRLLEKWSIDYLNSYKGGGEIDMKKAHAAVKAVKSNDSAERNAKIIAMKKEGKSTAEISKEVGLSYVRVWNILKGTSAKKAPKAAKVKTTVKEPVVKEPVVEEPVA